MGSCVSKNKEVDIEQQIEQTVAPDEDVAKEGTSGLAGKHCSKSSQESSHAKKQPNVFSGLSTDQVSTYLHMDTKNFIETEKCVESLENFVKFREAHKKIEAPVLRYLRFYNSCKNFDLDNLNEESFDSLLKNLNGCELHWEECLKNAFESESPIEESTEKLRNVLNEYQTYLLSKIENEEHYKVFFKDLQSTHATKLEKSQS